MFPFSPCLSQDMPYADPEKNRAYKKEWKLKRVAEKSTWLNEYKNKNPCSRCGKSYDPVCMDFHHVDPESKVSTISSFLHGTHTLEKLKEEVAKCEIICAHCHRLHHYKE